LATTTGSLPPGNSIQELAWPIANCWQGTQSDGCVGALD
jgi:hypothetical protein